jgi:hypothetical protein
MVNLIFNQWAGFYKGQKIFNKLSNTNKNKKVMKKITMGNMGFIG